MKACLIAIGSEMLTPLRADTNTLLITARLNDIGYDVRLKVIVGDDIDEIARQFELPLEWADLIVATGGLGPTEDDLTREAVARVLGRPLELNSGVLERIRARFARRGIPMPENNRRQAMVPRGAALVENANGTAPGLWLETAKNRVVLLPGPPREMTPMLDAVIRDRLARGEDTLRVARRVVKLTGRAGSQVDAMAQPLYGRWRDGTPPISATILATMGQIELHLSVQAPPTADLDRSLDTAVAELRDVFGAAIYTADDRNLETVLGELLRQRGSTIAVAESCTGGLLTSRLTDVPGSSAYVHLAIVCYSNQAKIDMLGVPAALIASHGAVSQPVAMAMAQGIRLRAGTNIGVAITGIAGPGGGTTEKPVGMVCIAALIDEAQRVRTFQFLGGREMVKSQAAQSAMNMVRLMLLGEDTREWAEHA